MLNRTTQASGQLEIKEGLTMSVDFNYQNDKVPDYARWNYSEEGVSVSGEYNVQEQKLTNYNVSGGLADTKTLEAAMKILARIKAEYKTI